MSQQVTEDPASALAIWRAAHPAATLAEIEQAVDYHLRSYRAALIAETATAAQSDGRPVCPECGEALQHSGERSRTVRTAHEGRVCLTEPTWRCPACGAGFFPPE
jgi:rubrerythrin